MPILVAQTHNVVVRNNFVVCFPENICSFFSAQLSLNFCYQNVVFVEKVYIKVMICSYVLRNFCRKYSSCAVGKVIIGE